MSADYFSPTRLEDALDLIGSREMAIVAGGTDFFPSRGRTPITQDILDVTRLDGMRAIDHGDDGTVRFGAATTWADILNAPLPAAFDGLKAAAREVGSVQIQNAGTIAGNICNASPAADGVPPLLTLDAEVEIAGPNGARRVPLADFLLDVRRTVLRPNELVTAVHIPCPAPHTTSAFEKLGARKYLVISITMTAVIIGLDPGGRIDFARVAVGSFAPVAQRLTTLEADLIGQDPARIAIASTHLEPLSPITDVRAGAEYRTDAVPEQIRRAVRNAVSRNG